MARWCSIQAGPARREGRLECSFSALATSSMATLVSGLIFLRERGGFFPHNILISEQSRLALWQVAAEIFVGALRGHSAPRGAVDQSDLHEVGLVHLFDGVFFFAQGGRQRAHAERPAARTSAKSRARRSKRFAMRGVPRQRLAISSAPPSSIWMFRIFAER